MSLRASGHVAKKRKRGSSLPVHKAFTLKQFEGVRPYPVYIAGRIATSPIDLEQAAGGNLSVKEYHSFLKWLLRWHCKRNTELTAKEIRVAKERVRKLKNKSSARISRRMSKIRSEGTTTKVADLERTISMLIREISEPTEGGQGLVQVMTTMVAEVRQRLVDHQEKTQQRFDAIRCELDSINTTSAGADSWSEGDEEEGYICCSQEMDQVKQRGLRMSDKAEVETDVTADTLLHFLDNVLVGEMFAYFAEPLVGV